MLHFLTKDLLKKKFQLNALVPSLFWDWIKCHVSDGLPFRLSLEPAVRLIYQFTILIPSYNAQNRVPFWLVPKIKKFIKAFIWLKQTVQRKNAIIIIFVFDNHRLAAKNKHKNVVFKHIQRICGFFGNWITTPPLIVLYDHWSFTN